MKVDDVTKQLKALATLLREVQQRQSQLEGELVGLQRNVRASTGTSPVKARQSEQE